LLGYHYLSDGHPDAAARQFQQAVKLVPSDKVASDVLAMVTPPTDAEKAAAAQNPVPQNPAIDNKQPIQAQPGPDQSGPNQPGPNQPGPGQEGAANGALPPDLKPAGPPIDQAKLPGEWKATRDDGSQFLLAINADNKFTWKFSMKGKEPQQFSGTYKVEENILELDNKEQGALVGGVTKQEDGKFNFKLLGAPPEDPGLNFAK
jgi:hypothetical protein